MSKSQTLLIVILSLLLSTLRFVAICYLGSLLFSCSMNQVALVLLAIDVTISSTRQIAKIKSALA